MGVKSESITLIELLNNIRNKKYVIPTFQRQYVWDIERIERLWDSILLDYPISTFLFWEIDEKNTSNDAYFGSFLNNCVFNSRKDPVSKNFKLEKIDFNKSNIAILDGQQRMTSLYLSLFGEIYLKKKYVKGDDKKNAAPCSLYIELDKNKNEIEDNEYNYKKYNIKFIDKPKKSNSLFNIKNIVSDSNFSINDENRKTAIEKIVDGISDDSKDYARDILNKLCVKIFDEKFLSYVLIYDMGYNDALEMFIRFNSGGKSLKKTEITMTILEAYWSNAKAEFDKVLVDNFSNFSTDFIIKLGFMLYGDILKFSINKTLVTEMKKNWELIKRVLNNLGYMLDEKEIYVENYAKSYNILMPILYIIYNNPDYMSQADDIIAYITRASLLGYFSAGSARKLSFLRDKIKENHYVLDINLLDSIEKLKFEL